MRHQPFADVLDFMRSHDACGPIAVELAPSDTYTLHCACGATIERPLPGPDARYSIIFGSLALVGEN